MAEPQDKLLGVRISDGQTTRIYSSHRIDYDDSRTLGEIIGLADDETLDDHYSGDVKFVGQTAIDRGYHSVKQGYDFKVLVGSASMRDAVQSDLDSENVSYTTEDVEPTQDEIDAYEAWGVMTDTEMPEAANWKQALDDLEAGNITEKDFRLGKNPHRGRQFGQSKGGSRGNGNQ